VDRNSFLIFVLRFLSKSLKPFQTKLTSSLTKFWWVMKRPKKKHWSFSQNFTQILLFSLFPPLTIPPQGESAIPPDPLGFMKEELHSSSLKLSSQRGGFRGINSVDNLCDVLTFLLHLILWVLCYVVSKRFFFFSFPSLKPHRVCFFGLAFYGGESVNLWSQPQYKWPEILLDQGRLYIHQSYSKGWTPWRWMYYIN